MSNIVFSMYLQYPCLCSFCISLFRFLSASLFGFCLDCLLRSLRLYIFIFFLNSSEIQGSFLSYLTPEVTLMEEDMLPSRRTCFVRLDKNECIRLSACGEMPCSV